MVGIYLYYNQKRMDLVMTQFFSDFFILSLLPLMLKHITKI